MINFLQSVNNVRSLPGRFSTWSDRGICSLTHLWSGIQARTPRPQRSGGRATFKFDFLFRIFRLVEISFYVSVFFIRTYVRYIKNETSEGTSSNAKAAAVWKRAPSPVAHTIGDNRPRLLRRSKRQRIKGAEPDARQCLIFRRFKAPSRRQIITETDILDRSNSSPSAPAQPAQAPAQHSMRTTRAHMGGLAARRRRPGVGGGRLIMIETEVSNGNQ